MTAVIWCCLTNLLWAEPCRVYALVTLFIQRLQTFLFKILVTFCTFFDVFLILF